MAMTTCPGIDALRRLDSESLDDAAFAALEDHLERCEACRGLLERALADAPALDAAPPPPPPGPPEGPPPAPGFAVERELGRGGHAVVYLATRERDGRRVALKFLGGGPADLARWRREAEAMRQLDHPGIVRLLDAFEAGGRICLVLEYVPGGPLADRLDPAPAPGAAARVVERVARAIQEVHDAGLLHLDLKPANVLLALGPEAPIDRAGPRVADFGLALPWGDPDATWTMAAGPRGTPSYMAPEQLVPERDALGPAADVYALGALLYRMLAGRPPFLAATKMETYLQLRDREPVAPRRLNPKVPADLETICLACLRKDPRRRYPSAGALADDLRRFLDGAPIAARPTPAPVLAARWCRRNPAVAGLSMALVLALASLAFVQSARLRASRADAARIEAERLRAEEHLRFSSQAFGSMAWMTEELFGNLETWQGWSFSQLWRQFRPLVEHLRRRRDRGQLDAPGLLTLGILATTLGENMASTVTAEEGAELLEVARSSLRACAATYPDVEICEIALIRALLTSIDFTIHWPGQELASATAFLDEAESILAALPEGGAAPELARRVASKKLGLARASWERGDPRGARSLLRSAERDLLNHPAPLGERSEARVELAVVLDLIGEREAGLAVMKALVAESAPDDPRLERAVAEWVARPGGPLLASLGAPTGPGAAPGPPPPGGPLFRALVDDLGRLGLPAEPSPSFIWKIMNRTYDLIGGNLVRFRQEDRIAVARRGASDLLRFFEHLAALAPEDAGSHWFLSEAMLQHAKNGWRAEGGPDYAEIRRWTARSREALEHAARLEPASPFFAMMLRDREQRLVGLPPD